MSRYANLMQSGTPQTERLDARQVENNAGGFVYQITIWQRLDRFLILGADAPTYYQEAPALTRENAAAVLSCYGEDADRTVDRIVNVSVENLAPKNDAAIFALALGAAHADEAVRRLALAAMPRVCRTSTHLFSFVDAVRSLGRGWGRTLKRAVADWYDSRSADQLAYQAVKYRERAGYSHKRMLQSAHPGGGKEEAARVALYRWICGKEHVANELPVKVRAHLTAMQQEDTKDGLRTLINLVDDENLPWEALPTWANTKPEVWKEMLPNMGLTALIRNLGNMTRVGAITPMSASEVTAYVRITDEAALVKERIHPFTILQAMAVYGQGHGFRGSSSWTPSQRIMDALDRAFYASFKAVQPAGKRFLIGLDVSGSMDSPMGGSPLSCREASSALAMVTVATEPQTHVMAFSRGFIPLNISPRMRLDTIVNETRRLPFEGTDCSLPMLYATEKSIPADVFVVITDNETYAGRMHPKEALQRYRRKMGINAKLAVIGMTASKFSIADPNDGNMLDFVGFDSSGPAILANFARG